MVCKVWTPTRFDVNGSENIVKEQSDFWTPWTYVDYLVYKNDSLYDETVNGEALYTGTDYKAATLRRCVDSWAETQINAFNQSAPVAFWPITVPAGSTLYIRFRSWWNNESRKANTVYVKIVINRTSFLIPKNSNTNWLPRELKEIWEILKTTIWGLHNNNEFYAQSPTTSVTTGNITPWNFVWYLQIWSYKIPYYL